MTFRTLPAFPAVPTFLAFPALLALLAFPALLALLAFPAHTIPTPQTNLSKSNRPRFSSRGFQRSPR